MAIEKITATEAANVKRELELKQEVTTVAETIEITIPVPSTGKQWTGLVSVKLHEEDIA